MPARYPQKGAAGHGAPYGDDGLLACPEPAEGLVYAALEHRIRSTLKARQASLPDQKGKATQHPTARWVFELFLDAHLLLILQNTTQTLTMNLKTELKPLLELLGSAYQQAYP